MFGHGWIDLAPNRWEQERFSTALLIDGAAVDVRVRSSPGKGLRAQVESKRGLTRAQLTQARQQLRHMLRLDEDFEPFWQQCRQHEGFEWVAQRGAGRLLRAPTLFEDLVKLLFTTNCTWALTRSMTSNLLEVVGTPAPSGSRAFPTAERCAELTEEELRGNVRCGYRAPRLRELATAFAAGQHTEAEFRDPELSADELEARLLALPGFGPYAAGQAMRLLGHYSRLALDSWCRAELKKRAGRKLSDRAIERRYAPFGDYRGLALWVDLTRRWHEQGADLTPLTS